MVYPNGGNLKRILVLSDFHCGHVVGLTPPDHQSNRGQARQVQEECWKHFVKSRGKYDAIVLNGDQIDGDGKKSGGTEQLTTDRNEQAEMAAECVMAVCVDKATPIYSVYGTGYHTGNAEDFEAGIPVLLNKDGYNGQRVKSHLWLKVEGVTFDFKHHVGSSSVPHGRHSAVARERLWNVLWSDIGQSPRANVLIRSHVHYHNYCGGPGWVAMTTPALQGLGSKYGARRCSGVVDFGYVVFTVDGDSFDFTPHILRYVRQSDKAEVL